MREIRTSESHLEALSVCPTDWTFTPTGMCTARDFALGSDLAQASLVALAKPYIPPVSAHLRATMCDEEHS